MKTENKSNRPDDFPGIGKQLPYKVPESFFDQISDKTLLESKRRSARSKRILLWYSGIAASILALALVGYWGFQQMPSSNSVAENKKVVIPESVVQPQEPQASEIKPSVAKPEKKVKQAEIQKVAEDNDESIADILADLSEDELIQLEADNQSDPFMEEFEMK